MQALATALMLYLDDPNNNKVKMLYQEWKALYGQVADLSSFQVEAIINSIGLLVLAHQLISCLVSFS